MEMSILEKHMVVQKARKDEPLLKQLKEWHRRNLQLVRGPVEKDFTKWCYKIVEEVASGITYGKKVDRENRVFAALKINAMGIPAVNKAIKEAAKSAVYDTAWTVEDDYVTADVWIGGSKNAEAAAKAVRDAVANLGEGWSCETSKADDGSGDWFCNCAKDFTGKEVL